jgi:cyclophilin family peptidyl-prolyl cis-trans isomerase/HEAT repeat protein
VNRIKTGFLASLAILIFIAIASAIAGCVSFGAPYGLPKGTYEERIETFARLLRMEDRRDYEPLLTGRAASSPDPWLRAKTALAAGRLRDLEASPCLPVLLADSEPPVRRAAAFGAGLSGDERLVRFLKVALSDQDPATARNAADALGKLGGKEAIDALIERARQADSPDGPGGAGVAAATALWRFSEPGVIERISAVFTALTASTVARPATTLSPTSPSPTTASPGNAALKRALVYALARKPVAAALPVLRPALRESDPELVAYAARALGILLDAESSTDLAGLAWSKDPSVAVQSLLALEKIGGKSALPKAARQVALVRVGDQIPGVSIAALRLLGRFPSDSEITQRLVETVGEAGWEGQTALVSLARVDAARGEAAALAAAAVEFLELKLGAAEAVGVLPTPAALVVLKRLEADPSARVRAAALAAASDELLAAAREVLVAALRDRDASVRDTALDRAASLIGAASVVGATGTTADLDKAWLAAYGAAFREKEPDFIVGALDAAAKTKDRGRALVAPHVDDADAIVREKARRLLAEKFGEKKSFRRIPVHTRRDLAGYRAVARRVNEVLVSATVKTSRGSFEMDLALEDAPLTVENFTELAKRHYFDGILIHRVVPDFVIQTGDPRGDGSGGPGYAIRDEINPLRYERGAVGMALSGPDTGGSQWFVAISPQHHLDGGYTVFGSVVSMMELVDRTQQDDRVESITMDEAPRPRRPWGATP